MTLTVLLWLLSATLIVVGVAGTVLPALPGTLWVLAGIVLGAWIDDFSRVGWPALVLVSAQLAVLFGDVAASSVTGPLSARTGTRFCTMSPPCSARAARVRAGRP